MPKISELVDQAFDTSQVKAQYGGSGETAAEAAKADLTGISALDPTNPENLPGLLHHGLPMAIQIALTALAGPGANLLTKMAAGAGGGLGGYLYQSGLEPMAKGRSPDVSTGGGLLNAILGGGGEAAALGGGAVMRRLTGKSTMLSEGAAAADEAANSLRAKRTGAELGQTAKLADVSRSAEVNALKGQEDFDASRAGTMQDQEALRADTAREAELKATTDRQAAEAKVRTHQERVRELELKHSDEALAGIRDEEVERLVKQHIGAPSPLANPTIETLTSTTTPVRESVQRNVRGVFSGISGKFESLLQPHYDIPVQGNFASAVDSERAILETNKEQVGKNLNGLMNQLSSLDANAAVQAESLPPMLKREYELLQRSGRFTPEQLDAHIKKIASGIQGSNKATADLFAPPDVRRVDKIRKDLTKVVIGDGSPVEKRVANRLIQNIDENLSTVLPEQVRGDWTNLRREWHEANNVFSPQFKSMLYKADTPEKVADVLYGSAKGKQADRVLTVIGRTPKDELPLLRSAFAAKLTRGDVVKNVQGIDKRVFKSLFSGTGFDDPKEWIETLGKGIDFNTLRSDPELYAKFNARYQQGLNSFGKRRADAALAQAEQQLRRTPDPGKAIQDALAGELTPEQAADVAMRGKVRPDVGTAAQDAVAAELTPSQAGDMATRGMETPAAARLRGEQEGMRTPLVGRRMQSFIEHHAAFKISMALATLGAYHGGLAGEATLIPLAYIGGNKAAAAMLANPKIGKLWYNALKSKNLEQAGFWLGRLSAAALSEGARSEE